MALSIFQSASPSPKLFDLANYSAEFLAPDRSNSLLKSGRTGHHIDMPKGNLGAGRRFEHKDGISVCGKKFCVLHTQQAP